MRLVTAVIKPHRLDAVKDALREKGIGGLTVTEARGFGRQAGHTEVYRGTEYTVAFVPKVKVEVVVEDGDASGVATAIMDAARTDKIGDGKVWILPVEEVFRVRTGEAGADAL
jgi:nitrogen regulatory protein P-II 1